MFIINTTLPIVQLARFVDYQNGKTGSITDDPYVYFILNLIAFMNIISFLWEGFKWWKGITYTFNDYVADQKRFRRDTRVRLILENNNAPNPVTRMYAEHM